MPIGGSGGTSPSRNLALDVRGDVGGHPPFDALLRQPAGESRPTARVRGDHQKFEVIRLGRSSVVVLTLREDVPSPPRYLFVRTVGNNVWTVAGHQMDMVTHNRKAQDVYRELASQELQSRLKRLLEFRL